MNTSTYVDSYISIYLLVISFDVTRPIRRKYKIAHNLLLCLIGMYVYSKLVNDTFSANSIYRFMRIFANQRLNRFISILLNKGYIVIDHNKGQYIYYRITNQTNIIIQELQDNYNKVLYQFCNKYNIVL